MKTNEISTYPNLTSKHNKNKQERNRYIVLPEQTFLGQLNCGRDGRGRGTLEYRLRKLFETQTWLEPFN